MAVGYKDALAVYAAHMGNSTVRRRDSPHLEMTACVWELLVLGRLGGVMGLRALLVDPILLITLYAKYPD